MKITIDLSWSKENNSINAIVEQFKINHFGYDLKKTNCRLSIKEKNINKLTEFLNNNNIPYRIERHSFNITFINFKLKSDIKVSKDLIIVTKRD